MSLKNLTSTALSLCLLAISAFTSQSHALFCAQDSRAVGSRMEAIIGGTVGVLSVSLVTMTPGATFSTQIQVVGKDLKGVITDNADVFHSEGAMDDYKGFVKKIKGEYDIALNTAKKKVSGIETEVLESVSVTQTVDGWKTQWQLDCKD